MLSLGTVIEVCAESVESALAARAAGCGRVELCDNMAEGGTTPSPGHVLFLREKLDIPLYPIIRPRGGDFCYSDAEFDVMMRDVRFCGEAGCDGIVTGILTPEGFIDRPRSALLVAEAHRHGMKASFHRALDVCADLAQALEDVISLGFVRVLTSGGKATVPEGIETIKLLNRQAAGRITVMPGSGITHENIGHIIRQTGCREIHGTFRSPGDSAATYRPGWADFGVWHTDAGKVRLAVEAAADSWRKLHLS